MDDLTNLNLGQLVGRALYGELPRKPQPALVDAAEAARARSSAGRSSSSGPRATRRRAASRSEASTARARRRSARKRRRPAPRLEERRAHRAAAVAARKRKATKAPPAPHRIGTSADPRAPRQASRGPALGRNRRDAGHQGRPRLRPPLHALRRAEERRARPVRLPAEAGLGSPWPIVREQIVTAVVSAVTGLGTTGANVFRDRDTDENPLQAASCRAWC
jgi:hypothetical protein